MAQTYKILGQSNPSAATLTDAYTVPASTQVIVSTINVINRSSTATSFRISMAPDGEADNNKHYIAFDTPLSGNSIYQTTAGFSLDAADVIRVYATLATLSFNISGVEIT